MRNDSKISRTCSQVRRSKLYHVRRHAAKEISKRMKMAMVDISDAVEAPVAEEAKAE